MAIRLLLIVSLLIQQLLVWPCLALCELPGACENLCDVASEPASSCAPSCQSGCQSSCDTACDEGCGADPEPESECEWSAICFLACASAVDPPLRQAPSAPTVPPHSEFIKMLALPVAFIAPVDQVVFAANGWQAMCVEHSLLNAAQRRSSLCCWLI